MKMFYLFLTNGKKMLPASYWHSFTGVMIISYNSETTTVSEIAFKITRPMEIKMDHWGLDPSS